VGEREAPADRTEGQPGVVMEANVDDLDPRLWPGVLARLMAAGASDAWLVPVLMKKGRPAHTVCVLCDPDAASALRAVLLASTTTLGVRQTAVVKHALPRTWVEVEVDGQPVRVKVGHDRGTVVRATPEFEDVAALARSTGRAEAEVLAAAAAAADSAGLVPGAAVPDGAAR